MPPDSPAMPMEPMEPMAQAAILNALAAPVVVIDGQDDVVFVNLAAESFLRASAAALVGVNLQNIIPQDSPVLALVHKVRATGNSM